MPQPHSEDAAGPLQVAREPLFTRDFLLTSLMTLATFSSFYLLLATMPIYITRGPIRGTDSEVGLVTLVFTATAVVLRPLAGKGADDYGKRLFILSGCLVISAASGLYAVAVTIPALLALRVLHGVGWAAAGTAANALIADLAPRSRRGEAMGYYGMFSNFAMAFGPAMGVALMDSYGFPTLFVACAALSVVSLVIALGIREPARMPPPETTGNPNQGIIERTALFPSLVLALTTTTYGAVFTFVPLYAAKQGIGNPGVFFSAYAVTILVARGITGRLSDRYGRAALIGPGLCLATVALWLLASAGTLPTFLGVGALYGLAFASIQPALMALVVDRAAPNRRGAAMGTFYTAMDLGIGIGSAVWGFVAQAADYHVVYVASGFVTLFTLAVFLIGVRSRRARR